MSERTGRRNPANVRFGSIADICAAIRHVRFTPDNDRESGFPHKVMSALPPKADMCGATRDVRFGPIADSCSAAKRHALVLTRSPRPRRSRIVVSGSMHDPEVIRLG